MKTVLVLLLFASSAFAQQPYRSPLEEPARPANSSSYRPSSIRKTAEQKEANATLAKMREARLAAKGSSAVTVAEKPVHVSAATQLQNIRDGKFELTPEQQLQSTGEQVKVFTGLIAAAKNSRREKTEQMVKRQQRFNPNIASEDASRISSLGRQIGELDAKIDEQMRAARIAATQDKEDAFAKGVLAQKDKENPNTQAVLTKTAAQLSYAKVERDTEIRKLAELEAMQGVNPAKDADNRANIQISKNKLADLDLKIANLQATKADLIAKRDEEKARMAEAAR